MIGVNEMLASDIARMVPVEAIFGRRPAPTPWPSSQPVLAIAVEVLPTLTDDVTADLIEHLARAIVNLEEEVRAVRRTLSASLELSHAQHTEIVRLQKRLADLLDERRHARTAAA